MNVEHNARRRWWGLAVGASVLVTAISMPAQQMVTETRDPKQTMDDDFAKAYAEWTGKPIYGSPLVDHLPKVAGIPSPKDVLGYHIGAPAKLTYYADILRYYRALAAATPRVRVETIGRSDENRELVVVWVSSDANMARLQQNRDNLKRIADPRGLSDAQVKEIIASTRPHYHLMGGLHSGETGPPEMQMVSRTMSLLIFWVSWTRPPSSAARMAWMERPARPRRTPEARSSATRWRISSTPMW